MVKNEKVVEHDCYGDEEDFMADEGDEYYYVIQEEGIREVKKD